MYKKLVLKSDKSYLKNWKKGIRSVFSFINLEMWKKWKFAQLVILKWANQSSQNSWHLEELLCTAAHTWAQCHMASTSTAHTNIQEREVCTWCTRLNQYTANKQTWYMARIYQQDMFLLCYKNS